MLGVEVAPGLLARWRDWFAPAEQPFQATGAVAGRRRTPSAEVRDTFHLYGGDWIWLTEAEFTAQPLRTRRALLRERKATGRVDQLPADAREAIQRTDSRVVWWPATLHRTGDAPLLSYVDEGVRPSRYREVAASVWSAAHQLLPGAAGLAGTFAEGSGPNCFGTVMAAAGVPGAEFEWLFPETFEPWLAAHATSARGTGRDDAPGTILVWRKTDGSAVHAAITIGGGYALSKPSQAWCSPRLVWTVRDTITANRFPGEHLHRYVLA